MDKLISSRASSDPWTPRTAQAPTNRETANGISPLPEGPVPIGSLVFADELPDGVVVADEVGRIVVFNRAAARLTGLEPAEVIGKFVFDVLPLRDADGRDWWVYADPYHGLSTRTRHPERSLYLSDGTELLVSVGYVRTPRASRGPRQSPRRGARGEREGGQPPPRGARGARGGGQPPRERGGFGGGRPPGARPPRASTAAARHQPAWCAAAGTAGAQPCRAAYRPSRTSCALRSPASRVSPPRCSTNGAGSPTTRSA